jgi:DNA primase
MSAVRLLAERSGIPMPDEGGGDNSEHNRRARIYEMNKIAAIFFRDCLLSPDGQPGYAFLRNRGLNDNTIRKYGLGFAPDTWNALKYHMNSRGYSDGELIEAFLIKQNERGNIYDIFRNRVMFPVIDRTGRILAFSGRRIDGEKDYKYVNTSNTPVYSKGDNIFSINFAKNYKEKNMILCEGNMDVVMLNQAGFGNAVAALGTALTPAQVRLLRLYCEEVILAYDLDAGGEKATHRTINLFTEAKLSGKVIRLHGANDPDDYIRRFGADGFAELLKKAVPIVTFTLDRLKESVDLGTPEGRSEYAEKGVAFIAGIDNEYDRRTHGTRLADDCREEVAFLLDKIEYQRRNADRRQVRQQERELLQPKVRRDAINPDAVRFPKEERAENGIISFLFHSPDKLPVILRKLSPADFPTAFNRKLFEMLVLRLSKGQSVTTESLGTAFSAQEMGRIEKVKISNAELAFTDERLNDYIDVLLSCKNNKVQKSFEDMTNEELLEYTKRKIKK